MSFDARFTSAERRSPHTVQLKSSCHFSAALYHLFFNLSAFKLERTCTVFVSRRFRYRESGLQRQHVSLSWPCFKATARVYRCDVAAPPLRRRDAPALLTIRRLLRSASFGARYRARASCQERRPRRRSGLPPFQPFFSWLPNADLPPSGSAAQTH